MSFRTPLTLTYTRIIHTRRAQVGGSLTLEYSLDMRPAASSSSSSSSSGSVVELLQVPKALWLMKAPALSLTLASAVNLASANAFGGGSDPFVVVYVVPPPVKSAASGAAAAGVGASAGANGASAGGKAGSGNAAAAGAGAKGAGGGAAEGVGTSGGGGGGDGGAAEPVFKTRVVEGSLNPVWNETFLVPLHVTMVSPSLFPSFVAVYVRREECVVGRKMESSSPITDRRLTSI